MGYWILTFLGEFKGRRYNELLDAYMQGKKIIIKRESDEQIKRELNKIEKEPIKIKRYLAKQSYLSYVIINLQNPLVKSNANSVEFNLYNGELEQRKGSHIIIIDMDMKSSFVKNNNFYVGVIMPYYKEPRESYIILSVVRFGKLNPREKNWL
jgi:hypothetical protein